MHCGRRLDGSTCSRADRYSAPGCSGLPPRRRIRSCASAGRQPVKSRSTTCYPRSAPMDTSDRWTTGRRSSTTAPGRTSCTAPCTTRSMRCRRTTGPRSSSSTWRACRAPTSRPRSASAPRRSSRASTARACTCASACPSTSDPCTLRNERTANPLRLRHTGHAARLPIPERQGGMTMPNAMHVQPYLFLDGRCEEALEFYQKALGAEVTALLRYKDSPDPGMVPPGGRDKVMHASFRVGGTTVMASDGRCEGHPSFAGFALSLTVPNETEAERFFTSLGAGGQVQMPLTKTFFPPRFGMLADRFGVSWMVYVEP